MLNKSYANWKFNMPGVFSDPYRIEPNRSVPWDLLPPHWQMQSRLTPNQVQTTQPEPAQPQRHCGTFLLRQGMESWTQAKRDAFIAEFGYI